MGIKTFFVRTASTVALKAKVAAPHLCVGFGVLGLAGAGVLACVQTAKHLDELIDKHNADMKTIREAKELIENGDEKVTANVTKEDIQKGTAGVYFKTVYRGLKVYALPIGLGIVSAISICYGHGLLNKRYAASTAAFAALKEAYDASRSRARERFGEDIERNIFDDVVKENVTKAKINEQTGEVEEETAEEFVARSNEMLKHPFTFMYTSDTSTHWSRRPGENRTHIDAVVKELNDTLYWRGFVTLNEFLCKVGLDPVEEGFINGWTQKRRDANDKTPVINVDVIPCHSDIDDHDYFRGGTPDYYLTVNVQGRITGFKKSTEQQVKKPRAKAVFKGGK